MSALPLRSRAYVNVGDALTGKLPAEYQAEGEPVARRFDDVRFEGKVQTFARPIRRVEAGILLTGTERRLVFVGGVPDGLMFPPYVLSSAFEPAWRVAGLLFDRGTLAKVDGRATGWPEPPEPLSGYLARPEPVAIADAWAAVEWARRLGFDVAAVTAFAEAEGCLPALREAAHHAIMAHVYMQPPRERLALYRRAAGALPGYCRGDASGPYCDDLFQEAAAAATAGASLPDLAALVEGLVGAPAGGEGAVQG